MDKRMDAFLAEAEWAPKEGYTLSQRESRDHRAMRANFVYKDLKAQLKKVPVPVLGEKEVLLQVGACGICGSDLGVQKAGEDGYTAYGIQLRLPVILGHELSGKVVALGKNVTKVKVNDLIAVEQIHWCGECSMCRSGMFNQCEELEELGLSKNGGFAEYIAIPEKYCCVINDLAEKLGDEMAALEAGALAEPTCVAYSGIQVNAGGIKSGAHVVIFGVGPIGLASAALARAMGAGKIIAVGARGVRKGLALTMGADHFLSTDELTAQGVRVSDVVMDITNGVGVGMVIEATGCYASVYPEITRCIAPGAKILQLGVGTTAAPVDLTTILQKNARICGSMGQAGSEIFPSVLRMMSSGRIDMRKMITGRFALCDIEEAMACAKDTKTPQGKVLVSQFY